MKFFHLKLFATLFFSGIIFIIIIFSYQYSIVNNNENIGNANKEVKNVLSIQIPDKDELVELNLDDLKTKYSYRDILIDVIEPELTKKYDYNSSCIGSEGWYYVPDSEYKFKYREQNYKIEKLHSDTCGTAGQFNDYRIHYLNKKTNEWQKIFSFTSDFEHKILGYGDNIVVIYNDVHYKYYLNSGISIFNISNLGKDSKDVSYSLLSKTASKFILSDKNYFFIPALIIKNNKLYAKFNNEYCYLIGKDSWHRENKLSIVGTIDSGEDSDIYYGACANGYYLLSDGKLKESFADFKNSYLKEAQKYDAILSAENFGGVEIMADDGKMVAVTKNDWLSPLLGRTINLIFAGEEEKAWNDFDVISEKISNKYPLPNEYQINILQIKEETQKRLKGRN